MYCFFEFMFISCYFSYPMNLKVYLLGFLSVSKIDSDSTFFFRVILSSEKVQGLKPLKSRTIKK